MKIAILSDVHDNLPRLEEALVICIHQKIETCICCGDVGQLETLAKISDTFRNVYLALGNADFNLLTKTGLFAENVIWDENILEVEIDGRNIAIVHHDYKTRELAALNKYDLIFYGHSHTPWEKKLGRTILLNPGEITGQFGQASFAIFDTESMKAELKLLK
jgi:hypothetical protein